MSYAAANGTISFTTSAWTILGLTCYIVNGQEKPKRDRGEKREKVYSDRKIGHFAEGTQIGDPEKSPQTWTFLV